MRLLYRPLVARVHTAANRTAELAIAQATGNIASGTIRVYGIAK